MILSFQFPDTDAVPLDAVTLVAVIETASKCESYCFGGPPQASMDIVCVLLSVQPEYVVCPLDIAPW
jgi:hypothetical protein